VIATRARDVMGAEVAEACITWRKGCSSEGASNVCISFRKFSKLGSEIVGCHTFAACQFAP
jgi:hypothetical protein